MQTDDEFDGPDDDDAGEEPIWGSFWEGIPRSLEAVEDHGQLEVIRTQRREAVNAARLTKIERDDLWGRRS